MSISGTSDCQGAHGLEAHPPTSANHSGGWNDRRHNRLDFTLCGVGLAQVAHLTSLQSQFCSANFGPGVPSRSGVLNQVLRWVDDYIGGAAAGLSALLILSLGQRSPTTGLEAALGAFVLGILAQSRRFSREADPCCDHPSF